VLLRLEGAVLLSAAIIAYALSGQSWWVFGVLFLAPDLSMLGYLANPRIGAIAYNAVHTTIAPAALATIGYPLGSALMFGLALILLAHIGFDRALGFGLKYPSAFGETHLGRFGRRKTSGPGH
jgi:hypothetical protein